MLRVLPGAITLLLILAAAAALGLYRLDLGQRDGWDLSLPFGGSSTALPSSEPSPLAPDWSEPQAARTTAAAVPETSESATASATATATATTTASAAATAASTRSAPTQSVTVTDPAGDTATVRTASGEAQSAVWLDQQADLVSASYELRANDATPTLTITYTINGTIVDPSTQPPVTFEQLFGTTIGNTGWEILASSMRSVVVRHYTDLSWPSCAGAAVSAPVGGVTVVVTVPTECFGLIQATSSTFQPFTRVVNGIKSTEDTGPVTASFPLH